MIDERVLDACWRASEKTLSAPSRSPDFSAATPTAIFASDEGGRYSWASVALVRLKRSQRMAARIAILARCAADCGSTPMSGDVLIAKVTPNQARLQSRSEERRVGKEC